MKTTFAVLLALSAAAISLPTGASAQDESGCRRISGISLVRGVPQQGRQQVSRKQHA
jgi:hypothetical protein